MLNATKRALQKLQGVDQLTVTPYGSFVSGFYNARRQARPGGPLGSVSTMGTACMKHVHMQYSISPCAYQQCRVVWSMNKYGRLLCANLCNHAPPITSFSNARASAHTLLLCYPMNASRQRTSCRTTRTTCICITSVTCCSRASCLQQAWAVRCTHMHPFPAILTHRGTQRTPPHILISHQMNRPATCDPRACSDLDLALEGYVHRSTLKGPPEEGPAGQAVQEGQEWVPLVRVSSQQAAAACIRH